MAGSDEARRAPPIGVVLGSIRADARWWLDSARRLDAAGYRAIWCWDHFVSRGDRRTPVLEAWTMLAAAAATTQQVTIGTFVANVMNRHPAVLARMASTLQALSGGRLALGIGIGGHPEEHAAYGIDFPEPAERAARLREAIAVIRALSSGGPVDFEGEFYRLRAATASPAPEPAPPILVGAGTPAGIRIAAADGDGWAAESEAFEALEPRYREALQAAGRDRAAQRVVLAFGGSRRRDVPSVAGHPLVAAPRDEAARWLAAGADELAITARTEADVDELVGATDRW